jgi:hypothetical protein
MTTKLIDLNQNLNVIFREHLNDNMFACLPLNHLGMLVPSNDLISTINCCPSAIAIANRLGATFEILFQASVLGTNSPKRTRFLCDGVFKDFTVVWTTKA